MKTVQEYLREADRDRLLDSIAYDEICNTELLLEYPDKTIAQIQEAGRRRMNDLIDHLLNALELGVGRIVDDDDVDVV